ncbi:uncharacterized protein LOC128554358, partial [Mercenaria mercenaria]|uniref:uncharacterized protein LOC128554358 n=1 Tax=Mercenaria mercenaria TaxID=6596 RepID=UPI00234E4B54
EQGALSKLYPDLEEQGAVSKLYPDLEQAGVEEITSAPKELSKLPDAVEDLWKNLDFLVTNGKSSPKHFSCRLDIAKVQFALTGEPKLISIDVLKEKDINLTVSEECLEVTITNLDIDIDESMDYIEKIFKSHIINNFKSIKLEPNSPEQCSALLALSKKVPVLVKHKKVVIYKCTASNTLNIVGETLHFPVLMKELGLSSNVEETVTSSASQTQLEIDTNLEESLILGYTGFEGYLKEKYPKKCTEVDVSQKPPKLKITSVGFSIEDAKEEKNKFLTSSKRKKIMMNDQRCCELLFKDEIYPNESVYLFLQGKLSAKMKSKRSEPKFCITKSENGVYVNCRDNTESEMAKIIEENIISCQAKISSTKAFEALDRWARSEKLRYLEKSSGSVVLCCTSDIHNKVLDDISSDRAEETEIPVTFPSLVVKFLRSVGSDLLQDIEGKFGVQTSFDDLTLKLKGHPSKLEDCKRFLNTEIRKLRRSLPLQLPKECLESKRNDLDKALQKQGCCCQFHYKGRKMAKMLSNCEYLVSWIDPIRQLKITAVKGCPWHLDVDLQIVFTNHCLFPVEVEIVPTNGKKALLKL